MGDLPISRQGSHNFTTGAKRLLMAYCQSSLQLQIGHDVKEPTYKPCLTVAPYYAHFATLNLQCALQSQPSNDVEGIVLK